jgi:BirA family biotin operon repressor/biotin-[acetyl-CoA-carboxylase] ligase
MEDSLAPEAVRPLLRGSFGHEYRHVESCPSTQRLLGPEDAEGTVAVADEQTEGRGRLGRRWHAPAGTSILCSVLLRPSVSAERWPELTLVAAHACAEAVMTATGLAPGTRSSSAEKPRPSWMGAPRTSKKFAATY